MDGGAKLSGMDCGACVAKVEKAIRRLPGISDVQVDLMSETMTLGRTPDAGRRVGGRRRAAGGGIGIPNFAHGLQGGGGSDGGMRGRLLRSRSRSQPWPRTRRYRTGDARPRP